jgi:hypothetical protein
MFFVFCILAFTADAQTGLNGACTPVGTDDNGRARYCLNTGSKILSGNDCTCSAAAGPADACGFDSDCFICPDPSYQLANKNIFLPSQMQMGSQQSVCFMFTFSQSSTVLSPTFSYVFSLLSNPTLPNTLYKIETGTTPIGQTTSDCSNFVPGSLTQTWGQALFSRRLTEQYNPSVRMGIRLTCLNSFFGCGFQAASRMGLTACFIPAPTTTSSTSLLSTSQSSSSSSSSSSGSTPSPSSSWTGTYQTNPGCNPGACCCLSGQVVVTQSGTTVSVQSPIAGQCGTFSSPTSFSFVLSSSTATTASATVLGQAFTFTKSGNVVTATNLDAPGCSGSATLGTTTTTTTTRSSSTTMSPSSGSATPCFHESTIITYKGRNYGLKDFQSANAAIAECRVPHVVKSDGVRINTALTGHGATGSGGAGVLRLTGDHLVFTGRGLIAADQITTADTLFGPGGERITVVSIDHESNQVYFGLNCLESVVYANGIRTSTFGKYHKIPELWMKFAGSVFGVHRASSIGDSIVELLARARII